jgi:adenosine deaminase
VAHAGEEGPPEYVREALDLLRVARIDHGIRALEDAALTARLVRDAVPLTVCPLSNLKLKVVDEMAAHPLKVMLDAGLQVTVNSDDPAYFGGYVNANYRAVQMALGLDRNDLARLARNSFEAAFLDAGEKAALVARLDAYLADR